MAYTPTVWECGDTITAEKLNKLEQAVAQGGSSEPLIVTITSHEDCPEGFIGDGIDTFSATWQEVKDAYDAGRPVYLQDEEDDEPGSFYYQRCPLVACGSHPIAGEIALFEHTNYEGSLILRLTASVPTDYLQLRKCENK